MSDTISHATPALTCDVDFPATGGHPGAPGGSATPTETGSRPDTDHDATQRRIGMVDALRAAARAQRTRAANDNQGGLPGLARGRRLVSLDLDDEADRAERSGR